MSTRLAFDLVLAACYGALALAASVHIVFNKRQPLSALLWLFVVWTAPFAGFVLYWYFGFNRIVERAKGAPKKKGARGDSPLERLGMALTGLPSHKGCRVDLLEDGVQAYPAMIKSIGRARKNVELLTYIFD